MNLNRRNYESIFKFNKKYVDLSDISDEKIATDLTLKTVEVEK